MHRNTFLLVTFLAIFAALLIGVNIGRRGNNPSTQAPTPKAMATPLPIPTLGPNTYTNIICGFTFDYPNTLMKIDNATGSAIFVEGSTDQEALAVACQKDIPRPPLPAAKIETKILASVNEGASVSANLYHDASPKDGKPMDIFMFRNPKNGLDVFIAGYGTMYNQVIASIKLLP